MRKRTEQTLAKGHRRKLPYLLVKGESADFPELLSLGDVLTDFHANITFSSVLSDAQGLTSCLFSQVVFGYSSFSRTKCTFTFRLPSTQDSAQKSVGPW